MNQNQLVREFLKQNERRINELLSYVALFFLVVCVGLVIVNQTKLMSLGNEDLLWLCLLFVVVPLLPYIFYKYCYNETLNRIICLGCLELMLCILTCNSFLQLDILFMLVPAMSMLYLDKDVFLNCTRGCFLALLFTKTINYYVLYKSTSAEEWYTYMEYRNVYEVVITLVLEYIVFSVFSYLILLQLLEMLASAYELQQSEDGTVSVGAFVHTEKEVQEAYNTKGLFLEIDQTIQNMVRGKDKQFVSDIDYELPVQLCGDTDKIKQALINLLSDFLRFTNQGKVVLEVTYDKGLLPKKEQNITVYCRITCSEDLSEDLRYGNTMGFALAKNLIQKMNGVILDKSIRGETRRTCYVVSFLQMVEDPETILHAKQMHQTEQKELISESRKKAQDILLAREVKALIVDDSQANQKLIDSILKAYGMTTKCVSSGEEAIEQIKTKKYDLALIDHMMPVKGGIQTAKEIRQLDDPYFEMVPLLAMTTSLTEDAQQMFYDCGFVSVVPKPIQEPELRQAISKCMFL